MVAIESIVEFVHRIGGNHHGAATGRTAPERHLDRGRLVVAMTFRTFNASAFEGSYGVRPGHCTVAGRESSLSPALMEGSAARNRCHCQANGVSWEDRFGITRHLRCFVVLAEELHFHACR